jgi:hypothetical protein
MSAISEERLSAVKATPGKGGRTAEGKGRKGGDAKPDLMG